jgi:hypothetical protein
MWGTQHGGTQSNSGQRESVDINHLLDEAVNLVYHGMRAAEEGKFTEFAVRLPLHRS